MLMAASAGQFDAAINAPNLVDRRAIDIDKKSETTVYDFLRFG